MPPALPLSTGVRSESVTKFSRSSELQHCLAEARGVLRLDNDPRIGPDEPLLDITRCASADHGQARGHRFLYDKTVRIAEGWEDKDVTKGVDLRQIALLDEPFKPDSWQALSALPVPLFVYSVADEE